jgi:hypothetical protein
VEFKVAIELGLDMNRSEGELVNCRSAPEGRGGLLVGCAATPDDLTTSAPVEATTTAAAAAGESLEVEVLVRTERARGKVLESEARLLSVGTLVVSVGRAREGGEVSETRCRHAGSKGQNRNDALHVDSFSSFFFIQIQKMKTTDMC